MKVIVYILALIVVLLGLALTDVLTLEGAKVEHMDELVLEGVECKVEVSPPIPLERCDELLEVSLAYRTTGDHTMNRATQAVACYLSHLVERK